MACRVSNLEEIYFPDKESLNQILLSFPSEEYRRVVLSLMVTLKDGKPTNLDNSFFAYNENYQQAVRSVTSLSDEKSLMFQNNVTQLAAAKSEKFKKAKANLTPEQQKALAKTMNRYQAAEYNAIVHRARVADQWETFQGERHLYPNLQWIRSRSASPREAHLVYAGRIWPMDDPFWQTNSPGCVWNCKCSWRTTDAPTTDNSGVIPAKPAPGLEGNPFITDKLITENHPYFEGIDHFVSKVGVLNNPDSICFIPKTTESGKKYLVHFLALDADETIENAKIVEALLDGGFKDIKLLPTIHKDDIYLRERYLGKAYQKLHPKANPDAIINDEIVEFKRCSNSTIVERLTEAGKKSDIIVLKPSEKLTDNRMKGIVMSAWKNEEIKNVKSIIIINEGEVSTFYRNR